MTADPPVTIEHVRIDDEERVGLRLVDGLIAAVGTNVAAEPGDHVIDGSGCVAIPGLVNGHTHAAMTLFRGFGDDLPLMQWLETKIWPAEARLTPDDVYWGTRLACLEMVRSGTTNFWDMYWHGPEVARAVIDAGMRATVASVFFDGADDAAGRAKRPEAIDALDALLAVTDTSPLVRAGLGPHAIYTVSGASLTWLAELAADRDLPVHIHLSETAAEVTDCVDAHGMRPAPYLDSLSLLGTTTVLAHGCWLDAAELHLVGERGATIVTNPVSNLKLANGRIFPFDAARERRIPLGLGTDGASSNNSLDLLQDVKTFALVQKHAVDDPAAVDADTALAVATGRSSPLLGGHDLVVGAPADVVLVRLDTPEIIPATGTSAVVYAATGAQVDTTIVAGRVLMEHRRCDDIEEILGQVRSRSDRLRG